MNVHSQAPTDPDAFLRWNESREGRRELVDGKIVDMIGATWGHARRVRRLARELEDRLDPARFEVATESIGVKTSRGVRYPDLVIDRAGNDSRQLAVSAPAMIVEVLSPSSLATDFGAKATEYMALPSLQAYLILAQDEARAWLWLRAAEDWAGPEMIAGSEGVIEIPALSLAIPLRAIYPDLPEV